MARRLHIGGTTASEIWEVLNAIPAPHVDHVCNANDLSQFSDCTFVEIYASHIVEHLDYKDELLATLKEWYRVLEPGGKLYISVPDLDILARLFIERNKLSTEERFSVMRMIFGGHVDEYDYHAVGLNDEFLAAYLNAAGFENLGIVKEGGFGLFEDTSSMTFKGEFISLNMIAEKPRQGDTPGKSNPDSYQT